MWYSPPFFFGRLVPKIESKNISPKLNGLCVRHRSTKHVFSLSFHSTQTLFLVCYIEMNCEGIVWLWWWHFTGKPFTLMKISRTQLELSPLSIFCDINFVQLQNGSGFWRKGLAWKSFFHNNFYLFGNQETSYFYFSAD